MNARHFRLLFEPSARGIVQSACLLDERTGQTTDYLYLCTKDGKGAEDVTESIPSLLEEHRPCRLLVLASFSADAIRKMLYVLRRRAVKTAVLPYVSPEQRLLLHRAQGKETERDLADFLKEPYAYLKSCGVEHIYFLCGNGSALEADRIDRLGDFRLCGKGSVLYTGGIARLGDLRHFEPLAESELEEIHALEGHAVPVVKAGYLTDNDLLFYFGCYGERQGSTTGGVGDISHETGQGGTAGGTYGISHETPYGGNYPNTTSIVMAQIPLRTDPKETDGFMIGKPFPREKLCRPWIDPSEKDCLIPCMHRSDHSVYRSHKDKERDFGCFGVLLLGNADLNRFLEEITQRFSCLAGRIRAVSLPTGGNCETWNRKMRHWFSRRDMLYWVSAFEEGVSETVLADIVSSVPYNQAVCVSLEYGFCFAGYLAEKERTVIKRD